jgi:hypothetical protein
VVVEQPQGVQTKDGGHIIPYSVLERERDRAARAEQTAQALAEQLQQLQAGKPADSGEAAVELSAEDLAQLDQDLPGVAKNIRALMGKIENLTGTVQALQQNQEADAQVEQQSAQDVINAQIAANPDLKAWHDAKFAAEKPDPTLWDQAADFDAVLRESPAWKDKPVAERFAKVAELVKATVPTSQAKASPATPAQLKVQADAALAAAGGTAALPRSSSDIPGGSAPPTDEVAAMLGKTGPQLTAEFMNMTPDQIEARLNRL